MAETQAPPQTEEAPQLKTNHNVRVVKLTTNESVLCLFGEVVNQEAKIIEAYRIVFPYVLTLGPPNENGELPIQYTRWCPYTPLQEFRISERNIVTVTLPDNNILENYVQELNAFGITQDKIFFDPETVDELSDQYDKENSDVHGTDRESD